jgi:hypothetical protein
VARAACGRRDGLISASDAAFLSRASKTARPVRVSIGLMRSSVSFRANLAAGRVQLVHVRAGTRIVCLAGTLVVTPPMQWLGESIVAPPLTLRAGEDHLVEQRGWVDLRAPVEAEFGCVRPSAFAPLWRELWRWLRTRWRPLTRSA